MATATKAEVEEGESKKAPPATEEKAAATHQDGTNDDSTTASPKTTTAPKKLQSAAMGLMSLMTKDDEDNKDEDKNETTEGEGDKKPEDATNTETTTTTEDEKNKTNNNKNNNDGKISSPPPPEAITNANAAAMAMQNSFLMQQAAAANFMSTMNTNNTNNGQPPILYPPPNMMNFAHLYNTNNNPAAAAPLQIPGPNNLTGGKSFPETLYEIISNPTYHHIISWLPHGQGFQIHDKQLFASELLPKYFDGAKFTSFTRRLKRWSFVRVSRGPELGAYYNTNFVRDKPELVQCLRYRFMNGGSGEDGGGGRIMPSGIQLTANDVATTATTATTLGDGGEKSGNTRELPNENEVTSDMASMRQVTDGIKMQMMPPETAWYGAVVYGNDGLIQLPRPSQLPKRERYGKSGKKDGNGDKSSSSSPERKTKKKKLETQSVVNVAV